MTAEFITEPAAFKKREFKMDKYAWRYFANYMKQFEFKEHSDLIQGEFLFWNEDKITQTSKSNFTLYAVANKNEEPFLLIVDEYWFERYKNTIEKLYKESNTTSIEFFDCNNGPVASVKIDKIIYSEKRLDSGIIVRQTPTVYGCSREQMARLGVLIKAGYDNKNIEV